MEKFDINKMKNKLKAQAESSLKAVEKVTSKTIDTINGGISNLKDVMKQNKDAGVITNELMASIKEIEAAKEIQVSNDIHDDLKNIINKLKWLSRRIQSNPYTCGADIDLVLDEFREKKDAIPSEGASNEEIMKIQFLKKAYEPAFRGCQKCKEAFEKIVAER